MATSGFRRILFFGSDVRVLEMFGFDEWISRVTLSIFRFMPTLGLPPLLKLPFFARTEDAKSRHNFEKKLQNNYGQMIVHETDSSASGFCLSCLGGRDMVAIVPLHVACRTRSPKESGGVFTPHTPPPRNLLLLSLLLPQKLLYIF